MVWMYGDRDGILLGKWQHKEMKRRKEKRRGRKTKLIDFPQEKSLVRESPNSPSYRGSSSARRQDVDPITNATLQSFEFRPLTALL